MRQSLHSLTVQAKADFQQRPRAQWITQWPGQLVISVSQIYWTQAVSASIRKGGAQGLTALSKTLTVKPVA